jgi:hypothetical protein
MNKMLIFSLKIILILLFACGMCQSKSESLDSKDIIMLLKPIEGAQYKINKPIKLKLFIKFRDLDKSEKYFWEIAQNEDAEGKLDYTQGEFQDNQIYTKNITYTPTSLGVHELKITLKDSEGTVKTATFPFEVFKESNKHKIEFDALDNKIIPGKVGVFTLNISNNIKGVEAFDTIYKFKEYSIVKTIRDISDGNVRGKLSKSKDTISEFIQGDELYAGAQKLYYHTLNAPAGKYKLFIKLEDTEGEEYQASLDFELLDVNYTIVGTSDKKGNIKLEIKEAPDELHNKTWTVVSYNFSEEIIGTLHEENLDLKYGINNLHFSLSKIDIPTGLVLTLNIKGPEDKIKSINVNISEAIYLHTTKLLDNYGKEITNVRYRLNDFYSKARKWFTDSAPFYWDKDEKDILAAIDFCAKDQNNRKKYREMKEKVKALEKLQIKNHELLKQKFEFHIEVEIKELNNEVQLILKAMKEIGELVKIEKRKILL